MVTISDAMKRQAEANRCFIGTVLSEVMDSPGPGMT